MSETKTAFKIKDWAGNTLFKGKTFSSFEDAWGYIYEHDPIPEPIEENEDHYYDDYYVEMIAADGEK